MVGLLAHLDTYPEVSGKDVNAQIHQDYDGGPIELGGGFTLTTELLRRTSASAGISEHGNERFYKEH